jgi:hypothetical protein
MHLDRNTVEEDIVPLNDAEKLQALGKKLEAVLVDGGNIRADSEEAGAA